LRETHVQRKRLCDSPSFSTCPSRRCRIEHCRKLVFSRIRVSSVLETSEYRRTHFQVYDENGFASTFMIGPAESATLTGVLSRLIETFHGTGGTGDESKNLVVLLGARIVAVVR
jgi:hypothetical protein